MVLSITTDAQWSVVGIVGKVRGNPVEPKIYEEAGLPAWAWLELEGKRTAEAVCN